MDKGSEAAGGISGMDALNELPYAKVIELAMMSLIADGDPDKLTDLAYSAGLLVQMARASEEWEPYKITSATTNNDLRKAIVRLRSAMLDVYVAARDMVKEEFVDE